MSIILRPGRWHWLLALLLCVPAISEATAQDIEAVKTAQRNRTYQNAREAYRERLNENVLFLMGGQLGAVYITVAHDIAVVTDDGPNLRVLPVVGGAGQQNVHDVVLLRGIDLALTNVQTLNLIKKSGELGPNVDKQVSYISTLFPEEMQILARGEFHSLKELKGKRVNFNNKGSSTALLTPVIFQELGIEVIAFNMSQPDAIQKMRAGELDATVCMCPTPVPAFSAVKAEWNFGLIDVNYPAALQSSYLPASISHEEYPNLMPKGGKIETIAATTVLISFNWPKGSVRYNRTAKFVDAFFSKFSNLQKPPRHPLWKSVNYAANLQGWQRFPAAQEWLDQKKPQADGAPQKAAVNPPMQQLQQYVQSQPSWQAATMETSFNQFIKERQANQLPMPVNASQSEQLFQEFMDWMKTARR
jgi:uncharacterized protein